jgi:hypothetical protein
MGLPRPSMEQAEPRLTPYRRFEPTAVRLTFRSPSGSTVPLMVHAILESVRLNACRRRNSHGRMDLTREELTGRGLDFG